MHVSPFTAMTERAEVEELIRQVAVGTFVTVGPDGAPQATLLPILLRGDRVIAHAARANPQFRHLASGDPALIVVTGPNAYISPNWYPSKAKAGRAVPTWDYLSVQLSGPVTVHTDPAWLESALADLTQRHEGHRDPAWDMAQAPRIFLDGLKLGIVGLEVTLTQIQAKAKLSQNRVLADREGVIAGLRAEPDPGSHAVADAMADRLSR